MDDLAEAVLYFFNKKYSFNLINIGSGEEYSIFQYAKKIKNFLNYKGNIIFDKKMPNGTPRKILNCKLAKSLGWNSKIKFDTGIRTTYDNFLKKI